MPADFAYASLHHVITPAVPVRLWRRRTAHYRSVRTWLMLSTLIGLAGFAVLPTAPLRLLSGGHGFDARLPAMSDRSRPAVVERVREVVMRPLEPAA